MRGELDRGPRNDHFKRVISVLSPPHGFSLIDIYAELAERISLDKTNAESPIIPRECLKTVPLTRRVTSACGDQWQPGTRSDVSYPACRDYYAIGCCRLWYGFEPLSSSRLKVDRHGDATY
ncbi:hypothetical protein Bbelb_057200 [Branchiostoma belcheri]|nr:hypothetical protein Bbelb_057200 [Branchiostoma belcheri]